MTGSIPRDLFAEALAEHQAGRLDRAERLYRQVLQADARHADSLHLLGVIAHQVGKDDAAVELIGRAIGINGAVGTYHANLAIALKDLGRLDEAIAAYDAAIRIRPDYAEAHYNRGNALKDLGRLDEAVAAYDAASRARPDLAEAQANRGNALKDLGRFDEALAAYDAAIRIRPDYAEALSNRGNALKNLGRLDEAVAAYDTAIHIRPDLAEAHANRGNALMDLGRLDDAIAAQATAILIRPDFAEAYSNRGNALKELGRLDAALAAYDTAVRIRPDHAEAHSNRGNALKDLGRLRDAVAAYDTAVVICPDYAEAHSNRAAALKDLGRACDAIAACDAALGIKPDFAEAHSNRGSAFKDSGRIEEAIGCYRRSMSIRPNLAGPCSNLGNVLKDLGRMDEAIECYRRALLIQPEFIEAHSNLLFCLNYHPDVSAERIFAEYRRWDAAHARPLLPAAPAFGNSPDRDRRLRIGYVSADFRRHSARHFIEPVLANHDRTRVEVFVYAQVLREDEVTARLKGTVDHWTSTVGMTDTDLAARIRADRIDVLVDLAGHTAGNRLPAFARKPAPIQASWLGYACTTGLSAIDYYLADPVLAPEGCEPLFAEEIVRLPIFVAYRPAEGMGEPGSLPALAGRGVTFGCLSRSIRINHRVVRVWAELLKRLPDARLVVDSLDYRDPALRDALVGRFRAHGVGPERLVVGCTSPPWDVLRRIDVGLDCFPHNSGTTLYETLHMGVPFITLTERPPVGRLGASILAAVGHPEWIAVSEDDYVERAVALAEDLPRLSALRAGLRAEMEAGPLRDEAGFARAIEAAYRRIWHRWCDGTERGRW